MFDISSRSTHSLLLSLAFTLVVLLFILAHERGLKLAAAAPRAAMASCSTPQFDSTVNLPAGEIPRSVTMGDVNLDGKQDAIVGYDAGSHITVRLGVGNGTFQAGTDYETGASPHKVALGDFNADGKPDLAVPNRGSGNISILLGLGNGSFQAAVNYVGFPFGTNSGIAVADLNRDGKQDLAVTADTYNNVTVLLGVGNGSFQTAGSFATETTPSEVIAADFNRDGNQDLAISNQGSNSVSLLRGNGNGTFLPQQTFSLVTVQAPNHLAAGDFNGDGKLDLATANFFSDNLSVLLGDGNGGFGAAVHYPVVARPAAVALGDFNSDGMLDLAAGHTGPFAGDYNVAVLLGNINGTFQAAVNFGGMSAYPVFTAVGDLNGDRKPDLITADDPNTTGFVSTLLNTCSCAPPNQSPSISSITASAPGFTGSFSVNKTTGVITINNASPGGNYLVTVTATDSCGATATKTFSLTVDNSQNCVTNPVVTNNSNNLAGSLRQAIANACVGSTITFNNVTSPITLASELIINKNLTIQGPGANALSVSGNNTSRVFYISPATIATIDGLTITQGNGVGAVLSGNGGGIFNDHGNLTLTNSTVTDNSTTGGSYGGGIYNLLGTVAISRSTISYNDTFYYGGGITNHSAVLTLTDSTVSGNSIGGFQGGGGILNLAGQATLTNSTITGNTATGQGAGGIWNWQGIMALINSTVTGNTGNGYSGGILNTTSTLTLTNSTVSGNRDSSSTGGVGHESGTVTIKNTLIANNTTGANNTPSDCAGTITSQGYNLIKSVAGATITPTQSTDLFGVDPLLGPLANNGGPTQTRALLAGSPAIDKGSAAAGVTTDQRGLPRPVDFSAIANAAGGNGSDIGAFESQNASPTITAAGPLTRQQGSAAGLPVQIATVSDVEDTAATLSVAVITGGTATGITIDSITNTNGTIKATVAASCTATTGTVRLRVTDSTGLTATSDLQVNVTTNTPPVLGTYTTTGPINAGNVVTIPPSAPPSDNGTITSITASAPGLTNAPFPINPGTGVVQLLAHPAGSYTVTVTATDNCGATTTTTFSLIVNGPPVINGFNISRQAGAAGIVGTIAIVSDDLTPAGNLIVTPGTLPTGITLSGITNTNGTIKANVAADCNAAVGVNTVLLNVFDGYFSRTSNQNITVNLTPYSATGGTADNFALPAEPVYRRSAFISAFPSPGWKGFDATTANRLLGYSFINLPTNIVKAELEIRMKPLGTASANDSLNLGLITPGNTFAYTRTIADLPGTGETWVNNTAVALTLNLANLPGGGNLLSKITTDKFLDVLVREDTAVDFMQLRYWTCPPAPQFRGMQTTTLGQAQVTTAPNGSLLISNFGASGNDGTAFNVGAPQLLAGAGVTFLPDNGLITETPGGELNLRISGQFNGIDRTLGTVTLKTAQTANDKDTASVDFSPLGVSSYLVEVYNGNNLVNTFSGHSGQNIGYQSCSSSLAPTAKSIPGVDTIVKRQPGGANSARLAFGSCTQFDFGAGYGVSQGDTLRLTSTSTVTFAEGDALTEARITGKNYGQFGLSSMGVIALNQPFQALGQANLGAFGNTMTIGNVGSTGEDGTSITVEPGVKSFNLNFASFDEALIPTGAYLQVQGRSGSICCGVLPSTMRQTKTNTGGYAVTTNFGSLNPSTLSVTLFNNNTPVLVADGFTSSVVTSSGWKTISDFRSNIAARSSGKVVQAANTLSLAASYPASTVFKINGTDYTWATNWNFALWAGLAHPLAISPISKSRRLTCLNSPSWTCKPCRKTIRQRSLPPPSPARRAALVLLPPSPMSTTSKTPRTP